MDIFKEMNITEATAMDWNVPQIVKRAKGDTRRLHKKSRAKLKHVLIKELKVGEVDE